MKSKSEASIPAPSAMTSKEKMMPIGPDPWMSGMLTPNSDRMNERRYTIMIPNTAL